MKNDSKTRRILLWSVVGLGLFGASAARAQGPSALAPTVALTVLWLLPGEPTGSVRLSSGAGAPSRLSFQGGVPHQIGGGFASCVSLEHPAGSAVDSPAPRFTSARVSPALVLRGFSSAGCPARVSDAWNDMTDELHGGRALSVAVRKPWMGFGEAAW
jgi:hypothetical protein